MHEYKDWEEASPSASWVAMFEVYQEVQEASPSASWAAMFEVHEEVRKRKVYWKTT